MPVYVGAVGIIVLLFLAVRRAFHREIERRVRRERLNISTEKCLRDKFCLMTFLLPILVAAALNFMGSIDLSTLGNCISVYWKTTSPRRQSHGWSGTAR